MSLKVYRSLFIKNATALFLVLGFTVLLKAQHQEVPEKPQMWKGKSKSFYDTGAISKAFQYGVMQGHFRYFYMNTQNSGELSDYYANSGGGGIRYETAPYRGLQFAVSGFYIFNLQSSNLGEVDTWALSGNRYELGLFDIEDPENKKDLDRLEEFLHQIQLEKFTYYIREAIDQYPIYKFTRRENASYRGRGFMV